MLCVSLSCGGLRAQLDLLTTREAESLVELVPAVLAAKDSGRCPELSVSYVGPLKLRIQARGACPDPSTESTLVSNYMVDRSTGVVNEGDNPQSITTPEMEQLRKALLARARERVLSVGEARCLALTAYKSQLHLHEKDESFSVLRIGRYPGPELRFSTEQRLPTRRTMTGGLYTVDITTAHVRDDYTGADVFSSELGSIASMMLTLRAPALLSTDDAIEVALQVPAIMARLTDACLEVTSNGMGAGEEAFLGIASSCSGNVVSGGPLAAVDLRTGAITDLKTGKALSSVGSDATARRLLERIAQRSAGIRRELGKECNSN